MKYINRYSFDSSNKYNFGFCFSKISIEIFLFPIAGYPGQEETGSYNYLPQSQT